VLGRAQAREDVEIVAACEEDAEARAAVARDGRVKITHEDHGKMLEEVDCDAVIVGDWFAKRGRIVIDALRMGRHVLSDKPLCTTIGELDKIQKLARDGNCTVGMMLDVRDSGVFIGLHDLVRRGAIGEIRAVSFGGQHPLLPDTRPSWYHEEGKQGGTINDIAVHGIGLVSWITGLGYRRVVAARVWKDGPPADSRFVNAGQIMLEMDNGAGLIADVSYFSPNSQGYTLPMYWRMTFWGSKGVLESGITSKEITIWREGEKTGFAIPPAAPTPGGYLDSFLRGLRGEDGVTIPSSDVFRASRVALKAQEAADKGLCGVLL
jgi:predicted dehydrogenase